MIKDPSLDNTALGGLLVLDFTRVIAGPYLTQMLGDLGAEIVKVETPEVGDDFRHYSPKGWPKADAPGFPGLNRNKKSIEIDMRTETGREVCLELAKRADILVENFRPGVMSRLGLDYETIAAINPRLIYCSISGYGHTGPFTQVAGYDPIAQAETGLMYLTGAPDGEPQKAGGSVGDTFTSLHAGMAVMAALQARHKTGRGQFVDVSLFDSLMGALTYIGSMATLMGEDIPRMGNQSVVLVPMGVYQCSDGPMMIVVGNDRQYTKFCRDVLERPELLEDARYATLSDRLANREPLEAVITDVLMTNTRQHWVERMRAAGVPAGSVRKPTEALASAEAAGRNLIQKVEFDGELIDMVASPFNLSDTPVRAPTSVPRLGEHTEQVLRDVLDFDEDKIETLRAAGTFGAQ
ncbi:MAG: CoA transferase [Chromatiales bacterium]|nr:CoA transferase [Chromatiales bacterium]